MHGLYFLYPHLIYNELIVSPFNFMLVMANFDLTPALRQFLNVTANSSREYIGEKLYVSIRRRHEWSQTIVLFPEDGYRFMMGCEVQHIINAADVLYLDVCVRVIENLPVIEVTDYHLRES